MKKVFGVIFLLLTIVKFGVAQKKAADITILYDITVESKNTDSKMANMFNDATTTVYISENSSRTESINSLGSTTTIYNSKLKTATVLKEYGNTKILVNLSNENWANYNKKFEGLVYTKTSETKKIADYNCIKYIGKMADGTEFEVYATNDLILNNKEYNPQFKNINGVILQYEYNIKDMKVINTASKVILSNIATSKFEVPKTGYREMTYEESLQKK